MRERETDRETESDRERETYTHRESSYKATNVNGLGPTFRTLFYIITSKSPISKYSHMGVRVLTRALWKNTAECIAHGRTTTARNLVCNSTEN